MALLDGLSTWCGPLPAEAKVRLRAVIERPTRETWHAAYAICLTRNGIGLWQAVCVVDPTFPTKGPGQAGARGWVRIPDQLTIVRAIRAAANGRIKKEQVIALLDPARLRGGP